MVLWRQQGGAMWGYASAAAEGKKLFQRPQGECDMSDVTCDMGGEEFLMNSEIADPVAH